MKGETLTRNLHPLDTARKRLERADENIRGLKAEVTDFLRQFPIIEFDRELVFTEQEREDWKNLVQLVKGDYPEVYRFRVLAGEAIHHLRSAFDHVAWQLSSPESRAKKSATQIGFPIFWQADPCPACSGTSQKNKHSRYCAKVHGVASPTALAIIESLQPYKRSDEISRLRHPMWLIHDMDRMDKHREVNVILTAVQSHFDAYGTGTFRTVKEPATGGVRLLPIPPKMTNVKVHGNLSAQIMFGQISERTDQPVIQTLEGLADFSREQVERFATEFQN